MLDVSSFKILFEERYAIKFKKTDTHLAMDDILESIEELKYYMKSICPSE
jgi:oligoribonuclease